MQWSNVMSTFTASNRAVYSISLSKCPNPNDKATIYLKVTLRISK